LIIYPKFILQGNYTGICSLFELKDEPKLTRLRDYKNWDSLSLAEKSKLITLCERLHPSVLESMYMTRYISK